MSTDFLTRLFPKYNLRLMILCLAFDLDFFDLLMLVFENYCKKLVMDINVFLSLINTYTLSLQNKWRELKLQMNGIHKMLHRTLSGGKLGRGKKREGEGGCKLSAEILSSILKALRLPTPLKLVIWFSSFFLSYIGWIYYLFSTFTST